MTWISSRSIQISLSPRHCFRTMRSGRRGPRWFVRCMRTPSFTSPPSIIRKRVAPSTPQLCGDSGFRQRRRLRTGLRASRHRHLPYIYELRSVEGSLPSDWLRSIAAPLCGTRHQHHQRIPELRRRGRRWDNQRGSGETLDGAGANVGGFSVSARRPIGGKADEYPAHYEYAYKILQDPRFKKVLEVTEEEKRRYMGG